MAGRGEYGVHSDSGRARAPFLGSAPTQEPTAGGATAQNADDPFAGAVVTVHDPTGRSSGQVALSTNGSSVTPQTNAAETHGLLAFPAALRVLGGIGAVALFGYFGFRIWQGRDPATVTVGSIATLGQAARVEIRVQVAGAVAQPGVYKLSQGDRVEDAIKAAGGLTSEADGARLNLAQRVRDEQKLDVPFLLGGAATGAGTSSGQRTAGPATGAGMTAGASQAGSAAPEQSPAQQPNAVGDTPAAPGQAADASGGPPVAAEVPARAAVRPTATARPAPTPRPVATAKPTEFSGGKINVNTATQAQLEQLPGLGEVSARRIITYRTANGPLHSTDDLRKAGISDALVRRAAEFLTFE
jgi:competence ComEA-like helix-hairpin-helix protein